MSPIVFWPGILTAVYVAVLLSAALPHNLAQIAGAALAWIVTFGMGWARWSGRSVLWLWRLAAAAAAIILVALVHDWLPRTDVFVIYRRNCPPKMGSFWPLFFVCIGGLGLQTFAAWGTQFRVKNLVTLPTFGAAAWWFVTFSWSIACGYVFIRNINTVAVAVSLTGIAKILGIFLVPTGIVTLFVWLRKRSEMASRKKALADYQAISPSLRIAMLSLIEDYARAGIFRLMYRVATENGAEDPFARVGGRPLAAPDELWPFDDERVPGQFLLQLPLAGVSSAVWTDRLVAVYLLQGELLVKSYACGAGLILKAVPPDAEQIPAQALRSLAVSVLKPSDGDDDDGSDDTLSSDWFIDNVAGLAETLSTTTTQPARVVSMLIAGEAADSFAIEDAILVGGEPELLQGPHEPSCEICQQTMRFLLQFPDVTESRELGDGGVGYVYGCDAHPEHCQGFVDCY